MKKKITIFILATTIFIMAIFWRTTYVWNGDTLENVIYKSTNMIIQQIQEGNRDLIILGIGGSLSVNEKNKIIHHDPSMILPDVEFQEATVLSIFYPFESSGLENSGKELSTFVNSITQKYDSITLIGHSKFGVCFANAVKWIKHQNITVFTISTPFEGTSIADKQAISQKLNWFEYQIYAMNFSNHKVDRDLIPNSEFMKNADYSGLENCTHINIISTFPSKNQSILDVVLRYLDKKAELNGDGIVPKTSQSLSYSNTITIEIQATHASSLDIGIEIAKKCLTCKNNPRFHN